MASPETRWLSGSTAAAVFAALVFCAPAANAGLYCCKDAQGRKVCADTMPTTCVGRETTLKTERGTQQLEGMATPAQRAQREEEVARKKQEEAAQKEQRRQDQALLSTYVNASDIDVARGRAEKDIEAQIKAAETKIDAAAARRKKFEAEMEFYKNKTLPEDVRRGLKDTEFEMKAQNELIERKKKDLAGIKAKFDLDKKRYEELAKARTAPR